MYGNTEDSIFHSIIIDTTLHEIIIEPVEKYSCEYFYNIFCCCFVNTDSENNVLIHV
jgi:hypothetical protein